jgi:hypothetical protein
MAKQNFTQSPDAPDQAAPDVEHLELHAEGAIALLQLFAQQVPAGYPADDMNAIKICALAELAVKILRAACDANTVASYTTAGEKVRALLLAIDEDMGCVSNETAALCFGLTSAIEAFLDAKGLRSAQPPDPAATASPAVSPPALHAVHSAAITDTENDQSPSPRTRTLFDVASDLEGLHFQIKTLLQIVVDTGCNCFLADEESTREMVDQTLAVTRALRPELELMVALSSELNALHLKEAAHV